MRKKCFKCEKVKPLSKFYKHPELADGHLNKCITCTKRDTQERYSDPLAIERIKAYERKRSQEPERKKNRLLYQRKMRLKSKGKYKARGKVASAIRSGRLKKGLCEECRSDKVQAHHDDYRKYLEVRWFCRKHHMEAEGKKSWQ